MSVGISPSLNHAYPGLDRQADRALATLLCNSVSYRALRKDGVRNNGAIETEVLTWLRRTCLFIFMGCV
jgi:hypothetical protein